MKKWTAAGLATCIAGLLIWKAQSREKRPEMTTIRVERGDIEVTVLATGVAQPQNRVEIKPPIAGRAEEILAREGQAVRKGEVLARMSSIERAALLDAARAKGPGELAHWEELYRPTPLIAPLDGVVISRNIEPGQTVTAQDAVLVMSNRLIVKAQVDETDIGQIRVGQRAFITLDAYPKEKIQVFVDHIAYEAKTVSNVTIYEVDVVPGRVPEFMRSGMTANVVFQVAIKKGALLVPEDAVRRDNGRRLALLPARGRGGLEPREVETGLSDGKRIEILSGLREGEEIVSRKFQMPRASDSAPSSPFAPFGRGRRSGERARGQ